MVFILELPMQITFGKVLGVGVGVGGIQNVELILKALL